MTPDECIRSLDAALAAAGEDVILRRVVSATDNRDVTVRAREDLEVPVELVGGIAQNVAKLIISPTQIKTAGWPNLPITTTSPFAPDPSLPKRGDKVIRQGRLCNVELVKPIPISNVVVRIELTVIG